MNIRPQVILPRQKDKQTEGGENKTSVHCPTLLMEDIMLTENNTSVRYQKANTRSCLSVLARLDIFAGTVERDSTV